MLKINKSISLHGQSCIEEEVIISFNANITHNIAEGISINQSISDYQKYADNKKECRKDALNFQEKLWEIEDQLVI